MLPRMASAAASGLLRPAGGLAARGFAAAAAAAAAGPHFCIVGSGPAGFYTADKVPQGRRLLMDCMMAQAGAWLSIALARRARLLPLPATPTSLPALPLRIHAMQLLKKFGEDARVDIVVRGVVRDGASMCFRGSRRRHVRCGSRHAAVARVRPLAPAAADHRAANRHCMHAQLETAA